jgi:histidyl-tRNA synthetase
MRAGAGADRVVTVMRAIDKLDRVGLEGVRALLGPGREDESGDFTAGAGLAPAEIDALCRYLELPRGDRAAHCAELASLVSGSAVGEEGLAEMTAIHEHLGRIGYPSDRVVFDATVVRGLTYYTGPVFEVELTFEVTDETGARRQFGSVAGGGRYDDLVERFLGRKVPATGASIGVDRLQAALDALGLFPGGRIKHSVLVLVMGPELAGESLAVSHELRAAGIPAEVFVGTGGIRAQMKYADHRGLRCAVLLGEDELKAGTVSIKDLKRGEELAKDVQDRAAWRRDRPAQVTVPRNELVATIQKIFQDE